MRTTLPILGVILAGALGLAPAVSAKDAQHDPPTINNALKASVEQKLQSEDLNNGTGPFVEVTDGLVTLTGMTKSLYTKNKTVEEVMKVPGVTGVEDRLEIPKAESDAELSQTIAKAVLRYPYFTIFDDVNLQVDQGKATLSGDVTMPYKSEEIIKRVEKVPGVQSIQNDIETLPTNIGDQRLRAALARRIYGNPSFVEYSSMVNPPIHIVVDNGRVELTGAVRSNVEKRQLEVIARSTFGVLSVKNELQVAS